MATAGLVLVLLTWLGMLVLPVLASGQFAGLCSRVQVVARALVLVLGGAYLLRDDIRQH
jgi:hypothetical protein